MPFDRKAMKDRLRNEKGAVREKVKRIQYPIPDLSGPGGNAYALLGLANHLMDAEGIPEPYREDFLSEARQGDYDNLLRTIQQWFTVVVAEKSYRPLPGEVDITTLKPNGGPESWEAFDAAMSGGDAEVAEAMEKFEESAEETRRKEEIQDRINREVRAELGLADDEVVVVKIMKVRKK